MDDLLRRYKLIRQNKCIDAIEYVIDGKNSDIYKTGNDLIKYHKDLIDFTLFNDPLECIKHFYKEDLEYRKECLKKANDSDLDSIISIIEADADIIEELSDEFIDTYNKVQHCIRFITFNVNYLTIDQKREYLKKYNKVIRFDSDYDVKVRVVK